MAKPKLKSSLAAHQSRAAQAARLAAAEEAAKRKAASVKGGAGGGRKRSRPGEAEGEQQQQRARKKMRATVPFDALDSVLLVGEGNFSFSISLVVDHRLPGHQLVCTAYDSSESCFSKYPDASDHVACLRKAGATVLFSVDAGALGKVKELKAKRFSKVYFGFPHVGLGIKDQDRNVSANQTLLLRFLRSAATLLTDGPPPAALAAQAKRKGKGKRKEGDDSDGEEADSGVSDFEEDEDEAERVVRELAEAKQKGGFRSPNRAGTVLIALREGLPYFLWNLPHLAKSPPPALPLPAMQQKGEKYTADTVFQTVRSFAFAPEAFPAYSHRRTIGWRQGEAGLVGGERDEGKARVWEFVLRREEKGKGRGGGR